MSTRKNVDLDFFLIKPEQEEELTPPLPVLIPQNAFMIHPTRSVEKVFLLRKQEKWHLVNPELVRDGLVTGAWVANLFEGIRPNGESFLLPVTLPKQGYQRSWHESLCEVVDEARRGWVKVTTNYEACIHELRRVKYRSPVEPQWPNWSVEDWITEAFSTRLIIRAEKKRTVVVVEEDEDE